MLLRQMRLSVKQLLAQAAVVVGGLVRASALQLGDHQIDEVHVAFRRDDPRQVEAVQAGFGDPGFQFVGHLLLQLGLGMVAGGQAVGAVVFGDFGRLLQKNKIPSRRTMKGTCYSVVKVE